MGGSTITSRSSNHSDASEISDSRTAGERSALGALFRNDKPEVSEVTDNLNVDKEILTTIATEREIPQELGEPITCLLAEMVKEYWTKHASNSKIVNKLQEKFKFHKIVSLYDTHYLMRIS